MAIFDQIIFIYFFRKSILIWQENGRENMLCDEKLEDKKHKNSP